MATTATRNSNTIFLEASGGASTIDAVSIKNVSLLGVILASGAAAETLSLLDVTTTANKAKFKAAVGVSEFFDLSTCPITFPNGIRVTLTQTDSFATLIIAEGRS